jgi:hypothetical protein
MSDEERIAHLGRVLLADDLPLLTWAAAAIVLLYAQPASRIVRLTLDDVIFDGGEVLLRLGERPSPVPELVAGLLADWIGSRTNMRTAMNRASRWLFARLCAEWLRELTITTLSAWRCCADSRTS